MSGMDAFDAYPVTLRGPLAANRQRVVTQARIFTHDGKVYVAESRTKGRTVERVRWYDAPEGEPTRRGQRAARWGEWQWSSCGCASSWTRQTQATLIAMAEPAYPEPVETPDIDEPDDESPGSEDLSMWDTSGDTSASDDETDEGASV